MVPVGRCWWDDLWTPCGDCPQERQDVAAVVGRGHNIEAQVSVHWVGGEVCGCGVYFYQYMMLVLHVFIKCLDVRACACTDMHACICFMRI
jgi:hypothetical protein